VADPDGLAGGVGDQLDQLVDGDQPVEVIRWMPSTQSST
jgi:hypothetical protein